MIYNKQKKTGCKLYFITFNRLAKKYTSACSRLESENTLKKRLQFNYICSVTIVHDLLVTKSCLSMNSD